MWPLERKTSMRISDAFHYPNIFLPVKSDGGPIPRTKLREWRLNSWLCACVREWGCLSSFKPVDVPCNLFLITNIGDASFFPVALLSWKSLRCPKCLGLKRLLGGVLQRNMQPITICYLSTSSYVDDGLRFDTTPRTKRKKGMKQISWWSETLYPVKAVGGYVCAVRRQLFEMRIPCQIRQQ